MAWPRRCGRIETKFLPRDSVASQFTELRVRGRRAKLHSSWCEMSFPREPSDGFYSSLHFHQPWGRCPQAGPTARSHRSVHRLVPPLTATDLSAGWSHHSLLPVSREARTLLLQTCKMYFSLSCTCTSVYFASLKHVFLINL